MANVDALRTLHLLARVVIGAVLIASGMSVQASYSYFYTGPPMAASGALGSSRQITAEFSFQELLTAGETVFGDDPRLRYSRVLAISPGGSGIGGIGEHLLQAMTIGNDGLPIAWSFEYRWFSNFGHYSIVSFGGGGQDEVLWFDGGGALVGVASSFNGSGAWSLSQVVPEPSTLALWGMASLMWAYRGTRHQGNTAQRCGRPRVSSQ